MLRVDLRELAQGPVETSGELAQDDPAIEGTDLTLREPVRVGGRLQAIGDGRFYWHGTARTVVKGECRRCLTPADAPVNLEIGALFTQDPPPEALQDPDSYTEAPAATGIDVTPTVREGLALAGPRHVPR